MIVIERLPMRRAWNWLQCTASWLRRSRAMQRNRTLRSVWPARVASGGMPMALGMAMLLTAGGAAHAQSMDFGALESLFGEPVTTSVTGSPQRASEVPASMTIITADEIRRSGARDIPGILRHVPGINVLQWTNDQADVGVRGYNQAYSSRLLVLVDGRQVYADIMPSRHGAPCRSNWRTSGKSKWSWGRTARFLASTPSAVSSTSSPMIRSMTTSTRRRSRAAHRI